jgi:signal transduction histidine kinase
MHGLIEVESEIDKGTTFTLTFPNAEPAGQGYLS